MRNYRESFFCVLIELPWPVQGGFNGVPYVTVVTLKATRQARVQSTAEWVNVLSGLQLYSFSCERIYI